MSLLLALVMMLGVALPASAQITCTVLGAFTTCSGPGGESTIQAALGPERGVIIGRETTMPYAILRSPAAPGAPAAQTPMFYTPSTPTFDPYALPSTPGYESPSLPSVPLYDGPSGNGY